MSSTSVPSTSSTPTTSQNIVRQDALSQHNDQIMEAIERKDISQVKYLLENFEFALHDIENYYRYAQNDYYNLSISNLLKERIEELKADEERKFQDILINLRPPSEIKDQTEPTEGEYEQLVTYANYDDLETVADLLNERNFSIHDLTTILEGMND